MTRKGSDCFVIGIALAQFPFHVGDALANGKVGGKNGLENLSSDFNTKIVKQR